MRILVTGASSLPGYRTALKLADKGHEVFALYYTHDIPSNKENITKIHVDITNYDNLLTVFKQYTPNVVIHMAAYGDVDECERNPTLAWEVNVKGTINVTKLASKHSEYLLYLSTDYVFDGHKGSYSEQDTPKPVNYYGFTKLCGEIAVLSSNLKHSIVRASSIYGIGPGRKNFAKFLIEKLSNGENIRALTDQYTSPTQASLLAEAIAEIIEHSYTGIFHIAGERMSRYEFALKLAETFNFNKSLINEAKMEEFKWFATRPKDSSLTYNFTKNMLKTNFYSTEKALNILKKEYEEINK